MNHYSRRHPIDISYLFTYSSARKDPCVNDDELRYTFSGNHVPRNLFISVFLHEAVDFIGFNDGRPLAQFLLEIVKNIYDHGGGKGYAVLHKKGRIIEFELIDLGTQRFDWSEVRRRGSTKANQPGNRENYGLGLGMIEDIAKDLKIDLAIDTSCGFGYKGTYDPSTFRH